MQLSALPVTGPLHLFYKLLDITRIKCRLHSSWYCSRFCRRKIRGLELSRNRCVYFSNQRLFYCFNYHSFSHISIQKVVKQCTILNRRGHPDYVPLVDALRTNLYPVVGERHWNQTERCTRRLLSTVHQEDVMPWLTLMGLFYCAVKVNPHNLYIIHVSFLLNKSARPQAKCILIRCNFTNLDANFKLPACLNIRGWFLLDNLWMQLQYRYLRSSVLMKIKVVY